jgi:hypothetical protein
MLTFYRILILEGLCTVIVGMACPFLLPNGPASAKFLSMEEKTFLSQRLENDSGGSGRLQTAETFQMRYVIAALTDWKIYLSVLIYWGNSICTYGCDSSFAFYLYFGNILTIL